MVLAEGKILSFRDFDSVETHRAYVQKLLTARTNILSSFTGRESTGASVRPEIIRPEHSTGSVDHIPFARLNISQELANDGVLTVSDKLLRIRKAFSLNMTELAKVLRVERPTLYAWFKDKASPISANYNRVSQVHNLATRWLSISQGPPESMRREPLVEGKSLLDILAEEAINEEDALAAFKKLALSISTKSESRSALIQRLGYSPLPDEVEESGLIGETEFIS